jgi:outer membrane protein, heavy metal efflux system
MKNRYSAAVLAVLISFAVVHATARAHDLEGPRATLTTLSVEEAVELALQKTPQLEAQAAAVDAAQSEAVAAGRLPDPALVLGIDNLPINGDEAWSLDRDFMTMRRIGVMQSFPSERKRTSQRVRADAAVSVAQSQVRQSQIEVAGAVSMAWVVVRAAELGRDKLAVLKPEMELQAQAARTALSTGRGSTIDALAAQSEVSDLTDRLLQAQRDVDTARSELVRWLGADGQRPLAADTHFDQLPAPRERLLATVHQHASLLAYDAKRALAQSEIDLAKAEKRPDWSAELAYSKRGSAFSDMVSLEFRVGLPLFSANRQDPLISAKRAQLVRLESERESELRMHTAEVVSALAAWDAAHERIQLYEAERLPLARQRSQAALSAFRAGKTELSVVMASHIAELEVQRGYVELMRELGRAWVFLRYLDLGREPS